MSQVYLSQFSRRAGTADTASYAMNALPAPLDTYIQYNRQGKFGAETHFRYIYPIHSLQHGDNTNALGYWSHAEGGNTYTGLPNVYSSSILSSSVTLSAEYGNITSSFRIGDYIYLNDYESDNIYGTTVVKVINTSWDETSSYIILDTENIHSTTSFVGSIGTYYIQNLLGNKIARAYTAHSEGEGTYAIGIGAHSEGSGSYAIGKYSHTEGNNTVALGDYQTIVGQYNIFNTTQSTFIIGDGYAEIIDSGTFGNDPIIGSFVFNINATYTPIESLLGSIITVVSASSSISETFIIDDISDLGFGEYEVTVNRPLTQNYYEDVDTYSILKITRHNLLFASQSYFEVSASNVFLQGIPSSSTAPQILVYDDLTGQVYYTASSAYGGIGAAPGDPINSIQYNANGNFGGAASFTIDVNHGGGTSNVYLTGSLLLDGAITTTGTGPNNVGLYGTASWALSASNALQAVSASYSPNFANANLTFTDNRNHDTNNYWYFIYSNLIGGTLVSGSYQYFDNESNSIGVAGGSLETYTYIEITSQSIDLNFNGDPGVPKVYQFTKLAASFSSSLTATGSIYFPGLISASQPYVVVIDTASGQLYYLSSSSFGGNAAFSGVNTQVVFFSGSNQISGSTNITYDYTNTHFLVTGSTTLSGSTFLPGINDTFQQFVLTYDTVTGQVHYTSSNALSAISTPLNIEDEGILVVGSPTFINFTGSGVSASINGAGVNVYIPGGGGTFSVTGLDGQVVFYSGSNTISGSPSFIFNYTSSTPAFNVSGAISSSFGENTIGFYGTASWAESASNALFAQTSSFITASNIWGPFGSSSVFSASYASSSTSASYAATASAAPFDTYIQYNKNGLFGAEQYFKYIYTSHSFEQGDNVIAFGDYSHAEGRNNYASASWSHVGGLQNTSSGIYQTVVGQNSIELLSQSAFIVGGGRSTSDRNNALTVIPKTTTGLFPSDSILEILVNTASISASYLYFNNLSSPPQNNILTYNPDNGGQVYYTSSTALGVNLDIKDEGNLVRNSPTFINFTGSNVAAVLNGSGVDVFVDVSAAATSSFNNLSIWNFTHSLNSRYVVIQTLDTEHKQIIPEIIELIDSSSARITFPTAESGYAIATIGGANGGGGGGFVNFDFTSSLVGDGATTSFNINHGFNTRNLHITVYESSSNGETVYPDIRRINANTASVIFANPPSLNQYVVYISQ